MRIVFIVSIGINDSARSHKKENNYENGNTTTFIGVVWVLLVIGPVPSAKAVNNRTGLDSNLYQIRSAKSNRLITKRAAGPIRLGMTIAEVRRSWPGVILQRTSDGEGMALIAVIESKQTLMTVHAGETNPRARINQRGRIEFIEVLDKSFRTEAGVHPKMQLREVDAEVWRASRDSMSEIEAREYATFTRQPAGIQLRVMAEDGMAGVYGDGKNTTTRYSPSAYVFSISIH